MRKYFLTLSLIGALFAGHSAAAFGTLSTLGQNREHERITRAALSCAGGRGGNDCFQAASLDNLAGKSGTFGAVGAPDNPLRGLLTQSSAHCDNGDFLPAKGYPNTAQKARGELESCRDWMNMNIDVAVRDAGALVSGGKVVAAGMSTTPACVFNGVKGRAKCNVLEDLGLTLHAAEDFYAHTNWVDRADASKPVSTTNPPGLGNSDKAKWLDLRRSDSFPAGLLSGCFGGVPEAAFCGNRVKHAVLNKDEGQIDPKLGAGSTDRGKVEDNFKRAATAAIADARDKWAILRERIDDRYGAKTGALIACALTHDSANACK